MKRLLTLLALLFPMLLHAQELALFDEEGKAVAYIAEDSDRSIYLWNGTPVAYLAASGSGYSIWGFNGKHLGWFVNGVVHDHNGEIAGATKAAAQRYTEWEPPKAYKRAKPLKGIRSREPYLPYWSRSWSRRPFALLLERGLDD